MLNLPPNLFEPRLNKASNLFKSQLQKNRDKRKTYTATAIAKTYTATAIVGKDMLSH